MAGGGVFAEGRPRSLLCVAGWADDARGSGAGPEGRTVEGAAAGHIRPEFFKLGNRRAWRRVKAVACGAATPGCASPHVGTDDARGSGAGPEGRTVEGAAAGHIRPEFFNL